MTKEQLEYFIKSTNSSQARRNRTVNIKSDVHEFYRKVSNHYDVGISALITNVLVAWKDQYEDQINRDIIRRLQQ